MSQHVDSPRLTIRITAPPPTIPVSPSGPPGGIDHNLLTIPNVFTDSAFGDGELDPPIWSRRRDSNLSTCSGLSGATDDDSLSVEIDWLIDSLFLVWVDWLIVLGSCKIKVECLTPNETSILYEHSERACASYLTPRLEVTWRMYHVWNSAQNVCDVY